MWKRPAEAVPGLPRLAGTTAHLSVTNRVKASAHMTLVHTTAATRGIMMTDAVEVATMNTVVVVVGIMNAVVMVAITNVERGADMEAEDGITIDVITRGGTKHSYLSRKNVPVVLVLSFLYFLHRL